MIHMKVDISNYVLGHGAKPRGRGAWSFSAVSNEKTITIIPKGVCSYSVAKVLAIREAKEQGFSELFLNP